ncbi:hypothetical protein KL933_003671 [Ogataea haglerorum]|uniref:Uncharacterized protein n=1 Tax=Ogataea haglerorum TaxID=1937702 RepID=A0AAN6D3L0_9ASCO|nr:hypothetical protein KL933_003671 [Ogataea haglerorum]
MSLEPATSGTVLWRSVRGPMEVALFAKQIPNGTRRFAEHVLRGNEMTITRVTEKYVELTGPGGEAVAKESNSRIRFSQPYMVVADTRTPGRYAITLTTQVGDELADWTILGKVRGDAVYWLRNLAGSGTVKDEDGVLQYAVKGVGGDILENVWNIKDERREATQNLEVKTSRKQVSLSFEDEDEEATADVQIRMRPVKKVKRVQKKQKEEESEKAVTESITTGPASTPPAEEAGKPLRSGAEDAPVTPTDPTLEKLRKFQESLRQPNRSAKKSPTHSNAEEGIDGLSSEDEDLEFLNHRWSK